MDKVVIYGSIPSKSNCYKVVTIGGHGSLAKTDAIKDYEKKFYYACHIRELMIDKPFKLTVDVFHQNDRPDLDNSFKVLLDCLQTCRVIKNDRLCLEIHGRKLIDKINPRVEFTIEELL